MRPTNIPCGGNIPPGIRSGIKISIGGRDFGRNVAKTWKKPGKTIYKGRRYLREAMADVFDELESFYVIIDLPYHTEEDFHHEVDDGSLVVKSTLFAFNYMESFALPENVLVNSMQASFNNSILIIDFRKRRKEQKK